MSTVRFTVTKHVPVEIAIEAVDVLRAVDDAALAVECARRGLLPADGEPRLTGVHVRGARALLNWSLAHRAAQFGVSVSTIKRFEDGADGSVRPAKLAALRSALQAGGAQFRGIAGSTCILRAPQAPGRALDSSVSP